MEQAEILSNLNNHYAMRFDGLTFVRDSGSVAYSVLSGDRKYFLRAVKPVFFDTAIKAADIHVFLQKQNFSVPSIIFTKDNVPYIRAGEENGGYLFILYEFIEGCEVDPQKDAEAIGSLLGQFHQTMRGYPGTLVKRDKHFYIGRYIDILHVKQYPKADEFVAYGDALWNRVKDLPRGYCHGDMYRGNIHKTPRGRLYILDFDTSCEGFPMYDPALICNMTHFFKYYQSGYQKSKQVLARFLPEYLKFSTLNQAEIDAFFDLLAVYHYQVQATVMEIFGYDIVDNRFFDKQLIWLYRWQEQCKNSASFGTPTEYFNGRMM